jgi:hypothetical protein
MSRGQAFRSQSSQMYTSIHLWLMIGAEIAMDGFSESVYLAQ